jgi:pimeloyl-ACP methyl ester carboxylesterase
MKRHDGGLYDLWDRDVRIPIGEATLEGELLIPHGATGLALFAHGSGSGRRSPRNQFVAGVIREAGIGTLLFDLLTAEEEAVDRATGRLRFDIGLLADRLERATSWVNREALALDGRADGPRLGIGYFGASTGAAAALVAAAKLGPAVGAVVSRGGRPDLAGDALPRVEAPTLLIVGGDDGVVVDLNARAMDFLRCEKEMKVIPGATHLFEEPGALEEVARLAANWFVNCLQSEPRPSDAKTAGRG